jgi:hypothetical protein
MKNCAKRSFHACMRARYVQSTIQRPMQKQKHIPYGGCDTRQKQRNCAHIYSMCSATFTHATGIHGLGRTLHWHPKKNNFGMTIDAVNRHIHMQGCFFSAGQTLFASSADAGPSSPWKKYQCAFPRENPPFRLPDAAKNQSVRLSGHAHRELNKPKRMQGTKHHFVRSICFQYSRVHVPRPG